MTRTLHAPATGLNGLAWCNAALLELVLVVGSLALGFVTLASGDYRGVLAGSATCGLGAIACAWWIARRVGDGGRGSRCCSHCQPLRWWRTAPWRSRGS